MDDLKQKAKDIIKKHTDNTDEIELFFLNQIPEGRMTEEEQKRKEELDNIEDIKEELLDDMRVELESLEMNGHELLELKEKETEFKKLQEKVRILESRPVIGMVNDELVIINNRKEIIATLKSQ